MRFLIQRVKSAHVKIDNKIISEINQGILVFIGIGDGDTKEQADYLINKLINLRIFADKNMKTNLSIKDINGQLMLVSQFTLYADCTNGNRPSFTKALNSECANKLYQYIVNECSKKIQNVKEGVFGADMQISLINDGPFTIMIER
ncbi:MAG: D-aminoacyl-tRNA deacylase [Clostridium sp.]|nr:D-aminoacyl-tRNA deacylase [Clostridium sp.]MCM1444193.1 D-aminoacyl-tRNA deacylase [Candidatus Amulumruptor caecigallinarius]